MACSPTFHPDWIVPDWPVPARVQAVCTTRTGGVSSPPFDSLNLGDHVHDDPEAVAANRHALQAAIGVRPVFLQQVHGTRVLALGTDTPDALVADACVAAQPGVACTIMVADCLPVLLTNRQGTAVAAAHAGWRGLAGEGGPGVLESVHASFCAAARSGQAPAGQQNRGDEILAWLGPCIGPQAFEVGPEVRDAFCRVQPQAACCFIPKGPGKFLADLAGLARQRLQALGLTQIFGNDSTVPWCTFSNPSRFFSHRRDSMALGGSGRLAACIWIS
jgi:polyphenol oxidase